MAESAKEHSEAHEQIQYSPLSHKFPKWGGLEGEGDKVQSVHGLITA